MNWQKPVIALAGVVGVAIIVLCYVSVLNSPQTLPRVETSTPVLVASTSTATADVESSPGAEPRLPATYDKTSDPAEISASGQEAMLQPSGQSMTNLTNVPIPDASKEQRPLHPTAPKAARPVDHRSSGNLTPIELAKIRSDLQLSKDQIPDWLHLVAALRQAGKLQPDSVVAGSPSDDDFQGDTSAGLQAYARPLLLSLSNDQMRGAGRLSLLLGFKNLSAMVDGVRASTAATTVHKQPEPRVAVTPALPPVAKPPAVADRRYEGLLTKSEIGRIKLSLKLTPSQDVLWPPVAAILSELGQQQMAQADTGQKLDTAMSGAMAQRFYSAAQPLLQTLTDDQKAEVRRRARTMGLEAYASYL